MRRLLFEYKIQIICFAVLLLLGLILAPVVCGSVQGNEEAGTMSIDAITPALVAALSFAGAALCYCLVAKKESAQRSLLVNPFPAAATLVAVGFFYGRTVAYSKATSILENYLITWGNVSISRFEAETMPEYVRIFQEEADSALIWTLLIGVAFAVFLAMNVMKFLRAGEEV